MASGSCHQNPQLETGASRVPRRTREKVAHVRAGCSGSSVRLSRPPVQALRGLRIRDQTRVRHPPERLPSPGVASRSSPASWLLRTARFLARTVSISTEEKRRPQTTSFLRIQ